MCVDDEKIVLDSLAGQLHRELGQDYLFEFAESGAEALELIQEYIELGHDIAVVISDQIMPVMTGEQFLIKFHELSPETVKILLTGQSSKDSIVNVINYANLYRYMEKPWEKNDFILTVKEAAKSYNQTQTLREKNINLQFMYQQLEDLNVNLENTVIDRTRELNIQKVFFEQLFANSPEGIMILDSELRIQNINITFQKLFQYSIEEVKEQYIGNILVMPEQVNEERELLKSVLKGNTFQIESVRKRKDNSLIDVHIIGYPIISENEQVGLCVIYHDISERKQAEEQLRYLSLHDSLTGLYNRAYFEQEMKRLGMMRNISVGILMCDIDGLKFVNDTLGHDAGDRLIQAIAGVLKEALRPSDMVARIGGDEFAILILDASLLLLQKIIARIQAVVAQQNLIRDEGILSMSIGFAIKERDVHNMSDVFKEADTNMYNDKMSRKMNR